MSKRPADNNNQLLSLILSTLAAAFGVQSDKNRERDFQQGDIKRFIIAGIIFTVLFIIVVASVVRTVLSSQAI